MGIANISSCTQANRSLNVCDFFFLCNSFFFNYTVLFFSKGREWLCLNCQLQRAQGGAEPPGPPVMKSTSKTAPQKQSPSPTPAKKDTSMPGSPQKMQSASPKVPAKSDSTKGPESQKQASSASAQKITPGTQITSGPQKTQQPNQAARKQSGAAPPPQQESGGFFGFGGGRTEPAKPEESVSGKMFGFGSSLFSSASTLITSAVQDEGKTPPVSPKMQAAKESKPAAVPKPEQDRKPEPPQQIKASPSGQVKVDKSPNKAGVPASQGIAKGGPSPCPICKMTLNVGSKDPPNNSTCTECKNSVCNQCGFNPMPNVKEVRLKYQYRNALQWDVIKKMLFSGHKGDTFNQFHAHA